MEPLPPPQQDPEGGNFNEVRYTFRGEGYVLRYDKATTKEEVLAEIRQFRLRYSNFGWHGAAVMSLGIDRDFAMREDEPDSDRGE